MDYKPGSQRALEESNRRLAAEHAERVRLAREEAERRREARDSRRFRLTFSVSALAAIAAVAGFLLQLLRQ